MLNNFDTSQEKSIGPFINIGKQNSFTLNNVVEFEKVGNITVPMSNRIINCYSDIISTILVDLELTDEQFGRYKYKPKTLSYDLYNSTEFWYILLSINNMTSVTQFVQKKIKVMDITKIDMLYKILTVEKSREKKRENGYIG